MEAPILEKTKDFYLPPDAPRKMCVSCTRCHLASSCGGLAWEGN